MEDYNFWQDFFDTYQSLSDWTRALWLIVPATHLQRFYVELCEREGWEVRHWCVMGHELGKLTDRVCKKRGSKRFMAYKILPQRNT